MGLLVNERTDHLMILFMPAIGGCFAHIDIPTEQKHLPEVKRNPDGTISGETVIDNSWEEDQQVIDEYTRDRDRKNNPIQKQPETEQGFNRGDR